MNNWQSGFYILPSGKLLMVDARAGALSMISIDTSIHVRAIPAANNTIKTIEENKLLDDGD